MRNSEKYTCPCCGYKTHHRKDHLGDLCLVCYWQSDSMQNADPYYGGGANRISLMQAQQNFIVFGACEKPSISFVRPPLADEIKDENWTIFPPNTEGVYYLKCYLGKGNLAYSKYNREVITYYFEANNKGEVQKKIDVLDDGKVLKYSELKGENKLKMLPEVPLDLTETQYFSINKNDFFAQWDKPVSNTFLITPIHLSDNWAIPFFNLKYNQTEEDLKAKKLILIASLDHHFSIDLTHEQGAGYVLKIKEGNTLIHFSNYINWQEAAEVTQKWVTEIEEVALVVLHINTVGHNLRNI